MDAQVTLVDLYKKGKSIVEKERLDEEKVRQDQQKQLYEAFGELWKEIDKKIPFGMGPFIRGSEEDIRDLVFRRISTGFHCEIDQSLPIYLYLDNINGVTVEYIVPAIIASKEGFKCGRSLEGLEMVWQEAYTIQTDDPARAVYLAAERYKTLTALQAQSSPNKPEPQYEPIERTQMVNPSLDDLINLKIEQALKKAMA